MKDKFLKLVREVTDVMLFVLLGLFLCVMVVSSVAHCDPLKDKLANVAREAKRRNVTVMAEHDMGSGVVWDCNPATKKLHVLTNVHIATVDEMLGVNHVEVRVSRISFKYDLMMLEGDADCGETAVPPKLGEVEQMDVVLYAGNPARETDTVSVGRVLNIREDGGIMSDVVAVGGFSGSGLWNEKGELVGLNMGFITSKPERGYIALAIPAKTIRDFLR